MEGTETPELSDAGRVAWQWIQKERKERPVGGIQSPKPLAWLASEFSIRMAPAALLFAGDDAFKYESTAFRREFLGPIDSVSLG